eukprot:359160-Chlamydomonas_euryale.AAC.4
MRQLQLMRVGGPSGSGWVGGLIVWGECVGCSGVDAQLDAEAQTRQLQLLRVGGLRCSGQVGSPLVTGEGIVGCSCMGVRGELGGGPLAAGEGIVGCSCVGVR